MKPLGQLPSIHKQKDLEINNLLFDRQNLVSQLDRMDEQKEEDQEIKVKEEDMEQRKKRL